MHEGRLNALGVLRALATAHTSAVDSDNHWDAKFASAADVPILGGLVGNGIHGAVEKVAASNDNDRAIAHDRGAESGARKPLLGDRRLKQALAANSSAKLRKLAPW